MSREKLIIAPLPVSREQIVTDGGIPAKIFDYVDKALEDPDTLQRATGVSDWFPCAWETLREIQISKERSLLLLMQGPDGSSNKGHIRVVDTGEKDAWKKPAFRGSLTLKSAQSAVATICKLAW
jgi:hypothetical protein